MSSELAESASTGRRSSTPTLHNPTEISAQPQQKIVDTENDHALPKRPWRRRVTPWDHVLHNEYAGSGTEADPYIVDWLARGDPENPLTWTQKYKWTVTIIVAIATMAVALASSTLSGATTSIEESFGVYPVQVYVMVTSAFVLGFVVGPLLWAPMSEIYGRRNLFIFTYILFTIFNGAVVASQNIWTLIILRFLAGTAGSSPLTNAGGTIADVFSARQRGLGMAIFAAAPFMGPALGPIIGGFLGETGGWRWVAALIAIFTALLTVMGTILVPETYSPVLLRRRADRLSKYTGKVYRIQSEKAGKKALGPEFKTALSRPWVLLFREPIVFLLSAYLALIYATLYMLFGAFPIVFQQARGWSPGISGLAFLGVLAGFFMALAYIIFYENPRYAKKLSEEGWLAPEQRLLPSILGGFLLPVGLFAFAWTAYPISIHWIAPILCSIPFGAGMVLVFLSVFNYLVETYLLYAASVLAANSVFRSLLGVGFPLFVSPMFNKLGINWACTLIAFLALAFAPLPLLFYLKGRPIRRSSKYSREADDLGQKMRAMAVKKTEAA